MWTELIWIVTALAVLVPAQGNPPVITNFPEKDLVNPEDVKFRSAHGFTLPCKAIGSNLTWTWEHNGTAITDFGGSSRFNLDKNGTLTGTYLRATDSGTYQCFVKNEVTGAVAFSRKLKVAVTVTGTFTNKKDVVVKVNLGDPFSFHCPPHTHSYGVVYSWGNSHDIVTYTFVRNKRRSILSNGTLYITYLTQKDIDDIESYKGIRCTISGANAFQRSGTLRLEKFNENQTDSENSTSPSWYLTPNVIETAVQGKSKSLYCFANGRPSPKITWKKDGRQITDGENSFSISATFYGRRLFIASVDETNHQGVYTCEAENAMNIGNPVIFNTTLTVEASPKWTDNPPPNSTNIVIENNGTLECKVTANPAAIVTWFKDGVSLQSAGHLVVAEDKLHLTNVNLSDTGIYQCEAENAHGSIISSTWVQVTAWKPSFENVQFGPFRLLNKKEAKLPCKSSTAAPQPSYHWFKDGELITYDENSRYKLDMDATLIIKEVDKDLDGVNYTCKAKNLMGEDSITTVPIILVPPMLTTEPMDRTILEGTNVTFQCSATGNPTPKITWTKDGKELGSGKILSFETNRNQSGKYWCSAENGLNVTINASAVLNVLYTPSLITLPSDQTVLEGSTATFPCAATGNPTPKISWMKDGKTVSQEQTLKIETNRNNSGKYWCIAENGLNSTVNASAMLNVQFSPALTTFPVDQTIMEGAKVTFHCSATGNPAPTITWTKDGNNVGSGEVLSFETNRNQSGEYVCSAGNGLNVNANASAVLDVLYKPSLATLPSDQTVLEGSTATFHCAATGNPTPKISWMKDGKTVSQEQTLKIETNRNDSGKYWCVAENGLNSTVNDSAMLDVQFPPDLTTVPQDQTIMEGTKVTFHCTTTGNPAPTITWTKDGKAVESGEVLSFETNRNQSGEYVCSAGNGLHVKANASAVLDVLYKPSLTILPSDQTVLEGSTATFSCAATGNPTPKISWMKDGKTVSQEQTLKIETNRNDSGKYWCVAENGLNSTVNASAMLDVQFSPSLKTTPIDQTIIEGATATFYCTATGNPAPKITWTMNRETVGSGDTLSFETNRNQSGKYWCSAENGLNVINASADLDVLYKPSLITIPTNQTALEGTLATFRCRADGNPTPEITWKKDGKTAAQGDTLSFEANRTQSGEYLCSAENGLNSTVSASAHLNVQFQPSLVTTPVDQTIVEGATASFHCTATGNPAPKITWSMDGKTVGSGETLSFETNRNQSGKYWCSAENGLEVIVNVSANLDVLYKPSLTNNPTNQTVVEGAIATFRCRADGNPTPKITWRKDGKTVTEEDTLSFEANRTQSGEYLCSAENGLNSTVSASAHLNVQFQPSLVTTPVDQTTVEGATASFQCTATGNPVPKITWSMNGKTVGSGETLSFETNRNQSGKYWCSAENGLDVIVNASASLDVLYEPSLTTIPSNQTIIEGTLATFLCRADGNPTPEITWRKDGKTVAQEDKLSFEANRTQSGEYLCSAENGLNSTVSASAHLNVQFSSSLVTTPVDQTIMEGATASFHCTATGNPIPKITWSVNGKTVGSGETLSFKTKRNQSGKYWCSADNGLDAIVNASANLDVLYKTSLTTVPTNQTTLEGAIVTFRCMADGNPTPTITWKKDGINVAQGDTLRFETNRTQSGEYFCSAENGVNSTVSASAHLNVQYTPSLITKPSDTVIMENQEVTLQCSATGNPIPKITWIKDGEEVDTGDKLSFKALRNHSGRYWCLAQNGLEGSVNASAYLDVKFPPSLITRPVNHTVIEGAQATFHCNATGNPTPQITWKKDGKIVVEGETLSLETNKDHSGKYLCIAENGLNSTASASANLDVQFPPGIVSKPSDQIIIENNEVTFQCSATGNPTPKITWVKDGKEVETGEKLTFKALRSQAGKYWCLADNGLEDSVNTSAYLDVQFVPGLITKPADQIVVEGRIATFYCNATGNPQPTIKWIKDGKTVTEGETLSFETNRNHTGKYWCSAENGLNSTVNASAILDVEFPPSIITKPSDKQVMEKNEVTFHCTASGNPTPNITWMKDGQAVDKGENLNFKAMKANSGTYWCLAENGLQVTVNTSAYLDVQFAPSFITTPEDHTIIESDTVTFYCNATGNPTPKITWIRDGKTVAEGKILSFETKRNQSGEYWCSAENGLNSTVNASANLDVQFPPSLKIKPLNQTIEENQEVTFHCTATGNPPPTITWIKDGKNLGQGDSWSFIAKRNHSGKYHCSAANGLDKTTKSSAYLNVQFAPSLITTPADQTLVESDTAIFYCNATGNPAPKITWIKDGKTVAHGETLTFKTNRTQSGQYWCSAENGVKSTVNATASLDVLFQPSLTTKPSNQTIIEHEEVTLHCTATGNPTPEITWIKDGKAVAQGDKLSFKANRSHSGEYWCKAGNGLNVSVKASAYLDVQFAPRLIAEPVNQTVTESENVTFFCNATGNPAPKIKWMKDGKTVAEGETLSFETNRNQSGKYWCLADNGLNSTVDTSATLNVQFPPSFITKPSNQTTVENEVVAFYCAATGNPVPKITWMKDGEVVSKEESLSFGAIRSKAGKYWCSVSNGVGAAVNASAHLDVQFAPSLIMRPTNQTVVESKTVSFNCSATGNPTPKITWLKDGITVGHGKTLSFEANRNQSGKYWCSAENGLNVVVNASAILDVQFPPRVVARPSDQTVTEKERVTFHCIATGNPAPKVTWLRDGETVAEVETLSFEASRNQSGNYWCSVENGLGVTVNVSTHLNVHYAPSLTKEPVDQVVLEGTEATFHCAADGNPEPEIKWIKDGKTVATQGLLTFEAMRNQSGKYLCSVENGLNSTVNASATLDVQYLPKFVNKPANQTVQETDSVTFYCNATGNPKPTITWYKDGETVAHGEMLRFESNRNDSGDYWCLAENGLKTVVNTSAYLDVLFAPSQTTEPSNQTVIESDEAMFQCIATGNPTPKVTWTKDGMTVGSGETLRFTASRNQSGKYWCSVENGFNVTVNASAYLDVHFAPSLVSEKVNKTVNESDEVILHCDATGNPVPRITWIKDGKPEAYGDTLRFTALRNHSGIYLCLANNGLNVTVKARTHLNVQYPPSFSIKPSNKTVSEDDDVTFTCNATGNPTPKIAWIKNGITVARGETLSLTPNRGESGEYWCSTENGLGPAINSSAYLDVQFPASLKTTPVNQTVLEGETATLDCAATGNPTPNIYWIKDGKTVGKGGNLSFEVNRNQSGYYWCVAENRFQTTANASGYLNVLFAPSITVRPTDQTVEVGSVATFHCSATGNPVPNVTWINNEKTVAQGNTLKIDAYRNHTGRYWCRAENGLNPTVNASANLDVQFAPSITIKPTDKTVIEGDVVVFHCNATGNPTPKITWTKDGKNLTEGDTLSFKTNRTQSGKYWCSVENGLRSAVNASANLDVQFPPSFTTRPSNQTVIEGKNVTFLCTTIGNPTPTITWMKDRTSVAEGKTLSLETGRNDSGKYWCLAKNGLGEAINTTAYLDVQFSPSIISTPTDKIVTEGDMVTFQCTATGNPTPKITWNKDGRTVAEGDTLSFKPNRTQSGKYWCSAENELLSSVNASANLDVQFPPSFTWRPANQTVVEGTKIEFYCNATGNPTPNIAWMKDGNVVTEGNTLSFETSRNSSGNYWCSAKNGVGETVNTTAYLDVQFPPSIIVNPTDQTVTEGNMVAFHCDVTGNPAPKITWIKDEKTVGEGDTLNFETNRTHSGKYWCSAENGLKSSVNASADLDVQFPPSFASKPANQTVVEGMNATFLCTATGNPTPTITWRKDGNSVAEGKSFSFETSRNDSGEYRCLAENGLGEVINTTAYLDVQFPPSFTTRPNNQTVIEGTNVTFLCTATGNPTPTIKWMKDGKSVAKGGTLSFKTSRNDSGEYRCLAENGLGEVINTTAYLDVQFSPSIVFKPTDKTVTEGDLVTFYCNATGNPTPKITWTTDGKTVSDGDTLSFKTNRTQSGKYWCSAENGVKSSVNASASLDVKFPPSFTTRPNNQTIIEGTNVTFLCTATGNPTPTILWMKNGTSVAEGETFSLETSRNDSGKYWCLAKNGLGEAINTTAYLDVQFSPSIITKPTDKTVTEGDTVTFQCTATGNPTPKITWMKDGRTVAEGDKLSFKTNRTQSGKYWCSAENGVKSAVNASVSLDVQFPPSFTARPSNQTVIEGTNVTFLCTATGNPTPTTTWMKDGSFVAEGKTLSLETSRNDSGKYWCSAKNGLGKAINTTAYLDVQFSPNLIIKPTDKTATEGEIVDFHCAATGNPTPKITWTKDGKTVGEGETLQFESNRTQSGKYWCSAENGLTSALNASAKLDVQFPPSFTRRPSNLTVIEGTNITFSCSASGNPTPEISWLKDGKTVAEGDTLSLETSRNDSGKYWCLAKNGVGEAINTTAYLDVQFSSSIIIEPRDETIAEGDTVTFHCTATGNPTPKLTWIKDRENVGEGDKLSFETNRTQSGKYWCSVENGLTPAVNASANLDVQYPPSFTSRPSNQTVIEGTNVTFRCSASGNPHPDISWLKDGKTVAEGDTLSLETSKNDSGKYWCLAKNGVGETINTTVYLDVQFSPSIITKPTNKTAIEGDLVSFRCVATGNPTPKISWIKGGKPVAEGDTLTLKTNRTQSGEYWCSAANGLKAAVNASANLDVQFPPSFTTRPSNQTVMEGTKTTFRCAATGNPTPKMSWLKGGEIVAEGDTLSLETNRNDSGKYWCFADNGLGDPIETTAHLDVQYPPTLTVTPTNLTMAEGHNATFRCSATGNPTPTITWMKDGQTVATGRSYTLEANKKDSGMYWCIADNGLRVKANASAFLNVQFSSGFTTLPSDQTVMEGEEVTFYCAATGNPTPSITWIKDGNTLVSGNTLKFTALKNDSGEYLCSAENGVELAINASAHLDVQYAPSFTVKPTDKTITEGSLVVFTCTATGNPSPEITWFKDGKPVTKGEKLMFVTNRNQSGEYWCLADNGVNVTVNASASLDVQYPPSFTTTPSDLTVREDNEARFHCTATGNPTPEIKWMRDGKTVAQGDVFKFSAKRNQSGEYRCLAENGLGVNITASASLDVQFAPSLISTPADQTVIEGTKTTFFCNASGNPSPKITWSKDGETVTKGEVFSFEANRNQSGEYWCSAENGLNVTVNASVHLDVQFPPSFTTTPSDLTVREDNEASFHCSATGNPTPTITWMKDGKIVAQGDSLRFSAKRNQSGEYRCTAANGLGVNITASASLDVQFAPSLISTPADQTVIEGAKATFYCNASGNPSPKITWSKDGKTVTEGETLSFEANRNQSGEYWCSAENGLNVTVNASGHLDIQFPPSFTTTPSDLTIREDDEASFHCSATGNPSPTITWMKDGKTVTQGDTLRFSAKRNQSGEYRCRAANGLGVNITATASLNVQFAPSLTSTPADQTVIEGTKTTFHCNASGNPSPKITWSKDGKTVTKGETLSFEANRNQSGEYWCSAENGLNVTVNASVHLDVQFAPSFTVIPSDLTVREGNEVSFHCSATGNPTPTITWMKDGMTVASGNVLRFSAKRNQSGEYYCSAVNGLGVNITASASLDVQFAPSLISTPADQTVIEGTKTTFYCNASGNPSPKITWSKDGKTVTEGETLSFEANRNQSGEYWCSAENGLNVTVNASVHLDVQFAPSFTVIPSDLTVREGNEVSFHCSATGNPTPTITWMKDGMTVASGNVLRFSTKRNQSGVYHCSAVNGLGVNITASASLDVQFAPSLISTPADQTVIEGTKTTFYCNASGNPSPKITWSKDGKTVTEGETLSFEANRNQSGEYWCSAENGLSVTVNASVHLDVQYPVSFTSTPEEQTIKEGDGVTFKCSATGNPTPEVTWIKDGKTVGLGETLRLTSVDRNQSGEYLCAVVNGLSVNITTSVKLDVQFSPSLVKTPTNKTIFEGETATFHCTATGNPVPEITWIKDGKTVGSGETLSFETRRNQSGKYWCSVDNGIDKAANASAYLNVHYPLSLTTTPSDQTVREGETAEFHCSATGNPPPVVIWIKDGEAVSQGDKLSFETSKDQSGKYWCKARNELGLTVNASALLNVLFSPTVDTKPVNKTVTEGTMATFYCNATGNPTPKIIWIRDGVTVAQGNTLSFETNRTQTGEYLCLAKNGLSPNASASANLDVQFPPELAIKPADQTITEGNEVTFHCAANGNPAPKIKWVKGEATVAVGGTLTFEANRNHSGPYLCVVENGVDEEVKASANLDVLFPPSFASKPINKTVTEGTMATFYCNATGNPTPKITWIRDGVTVAQGNTLSFETNRTQSGEYLCLAKNGLSPNAIASANLDVQFPPEFTTKPVDQTVTEGNSVSFHCAANGNPTPNIKWVKDENAVASGGMLTFEARRNDSGPYLCLAENGLTADIKATASLDVLYGPSFTTRPNDQIVVEGAMVTFNCYAIGNPVPDIVWVKDGKTVTVGNILSLKTSRNQSGKYWCLAKNDLKTVNASVNLEVQFSPSFTSKPVSQTVNEGDETTLQCSATGNPAPTITWFKDGSTVASGETFKFSANRTQSGTYWCSAENGLGVAVNTSASLDVQFPPSCAVTPKSHSVIEGHVASFRCSATGNPTPNLTWYKDGVVVASGDILRFTASRNQSGQYWCSAENIFNATAKASGSLEVHFKPEKTRLSVTSDVTEPVKFGSSVKFTCTAESRPTVEVYKFYRDQLLLGSNISGIYEVQLQRSGRYTCVPINRAGNGTESSIYIKVDARKPYFPEEVPPVYLFKDSQARLPCKPEGEPQPIVKWFKDGVAISDKRNASYRLESDGTLIIDKVKNGDAGKYTCMAENFLGKANVTALGILLERTKIFERPPQTQTVSQGTNVELKCYATADPTLELRYIWKKDGIEVVNSSKPENVLRISNITVDEAGVYTCVAYTPEPKRSEDSVSAIVSIRGVPPPPKNLKITDCDDRTTILSWTPVASNNAPITHYLIYQESNHEPTVFKLVDSVTSPNVSSFSLSLPGWASLRFRVRAVNDNGPGRPSLSTAKGACDTPSVDPEIYPTNLRGVPGKANELFIYWDPVPKDQWNAEGFYYTLKYRRVNGRISEWIDEKIADPGVNMFELSNPGYYQQWEFTIGAGNHEGVGPASPMESAYSGQDAPVVKPESSKVGEVSDDGVTLSWEPVTVKRGSVDGYRIYYWGESLAVSSRRKRRAIPSTAEKFEVIGGSKTEATISGLKPYTAYSAAVKAFNSGGEGPASPIISFETSEGEPGPPSDVFIDAFGEFLLITWTPPQEPNGIIIGYQVGWAEYDGLSSEIVVLAMEPVEATVRKILLKDKKFETSYVVEVQARTSKGWGPGLRRTTTTIKKSAPAKPLKPTVKQILGKNSFNVTYNFAVGGGWTNEFKVLYRKQAAEGEEYLETSWVDHFPRRWTEIDDLSPDTYEFKTVARNNVGMSEESDATIASLIDEGKVDIVKKEDSSTYSSDWFITVIIIAAVVVLLLIIVFVVKQCRKRRSEDLDASDKENEANKENPKPIDFKPREDWRTRLERVDEADSESHDSLDEYGGGGAYFSEDGSFVGEFEAKKSDSAHEEVQDPAV